MQLRDRLARRAVGGRRATEGLPVARDEVAERREPGGLRHFIEAATAKIKLLPALAEKSATPEMAGASA